MGRFREREDSVKITVMGAYCDLVRQVGGNFWRASVGTSHDTCMFGGGVRVARGTAVGRDTGATRAGRNRAHPQVAAAARHYGSPDDPGNPLAVLRAGALACTRGRAPPRIKRRLKPPPRARAAAAALLLLSARARHCA